MQELEAGGLQGRESVAGRVGSECLEGLERVTSSGEVEGLIRVGFVAVWTRPIALGLGLVVVGGDILVLWVGLVGVWVGLIVVGVDILVLWVGLVGVWVWLVVVWTGPMILTVGPVVLRVEIMGLWVEPVVV